jgi:GNAT superfamily N-acetyltransferase
LSENNARVFRPVKPADIELICEIAVKAWQPIFASYRRMLGDELFEALHTGWEARKANQVRQAALRQPDCVYVTEVDGATVGFTTFHVDENTRLGTIGNNAVDPDCQSRGVGSFQHEQVLELMRQRGMRFAKVTTGLDEGHAPARRSYEKVGFDRSTPDVTYYRHL